MIQPGAASPRPAWLATRLVSEAASITVLYVAVALLGLQYAGSDGVSPLWPSAGLAVAAVLLRGQHALMAVAIGSGIVNVIDRTSVPLTLWVMGVSTVEAWVTARLMTRWSTSGAFRTLNDVPGFFAAAVVGTAGCAAIAAVGMKLYGANTAAVGLASLFKTWWSGGLVGILVVTPLLLEWSRHHVWTRSGVRWFEVGLLLVTVGAIGGGALVWATENTSPYMVFAPLAWASWRFGARGATAASVFFAAVVLQSTALGMGPFAGRDTLHVQLFLLCVTVTAVFLGLASQATQDALETARASEVASVERLTQVEEIFAQSPNGLAFLDRELTYRHVNQRFAAVLGLGVADCLDRSVFETDAASNGPRWGALLSADLRSVLASGRPIADLMYAWPAAAASDVAKVWRVGVWPHTSPHGDTAGLYIETVDITELRRAEDERWALERKLAAAREHESRALRQSDAMKSALLSSVSHELRTPLTSLRTAVSSLADGALPPGTRRELSANAVADAEYLSRLVNNLLDMSRLEGGTLVPDRQWHTAEELIETSVRRVGEPLAARALEVSVSDGIPPLHVDGVQIQMALVNLLDNAAKYSEPSTALSLAAVWDPSLGVIFIVRNAGEALSPEDERRVFDRFYRGPRTGASRTRGLGLGLAIAKGAVESHGGRIWTRRDGAWTEFGFHLPVASDGGRWTLPTEEPHGR